MSAIIETHNLTRQYGRQTVVRDLSLKVPAGSIFALLGPNGAGKTTTIKMLMNIIEPSSGMARVLGTPSTRLSPREMRQIGYVSENQEQPEWMTVRQFLNFCRGLYPGWDQNFAEHLMRQFDLPGDKKLKHLSRGMRMKAVLLSSLAYRPNLLILDEPFSGLDPLARDEFISGMLNVAEEGNWTIVISSHDINEVEKLVDWVGFLDRGELKFCESVTSLQQRFQRVQATLDVPLELSAPPPLPLPEWYEVRASGHALSLVESQYRAEDLTTRVGQVYPTARDIEVIPMSLREIFVSVSRKSTATEKN